MPIVYSLLYILTVSIGFTFLFIFYLCISLCVEGGHITQNIVIGQITVETPGHGLVLLLESRQNTPPPPKKKKQKKKKIK